MSPLRSLFRVRNGLGACCSRIAHEALPIGLPFSLRDFLPHGHVECVADRHAHRHDAASFLDGPAAGHGLFSSPQLPDDLFGGMSLSFHGSHWRSRAGTLVGHGPVWGEHSRLVSEDYTRRGV
jgi:hypothetical protein